ETQGVGSGERLDTLLEIRPRHRLVHVVVQADLDTADGVRHEYEPQEPDLRVVVDLDAGQVAHGSDEGVAARLFRGPGGLLLRGAPGEFAVHRVLVGHTEHTVDLRVAQLRSRDIRVAGDGDCGRRRSVLGNADEQDGV